MSTSSKPTPIKDGDDYDFDQTALERFHDGTSVNFVADFGIWRLSLCDAAELVVRDIHNSGEDDFGISESMELDSQSDDFLAPATAQFQGYLASSIESGNLTAEQIGRDFAGVLVPERTFIHFRELQRWLLERDYESGDVIREYQFFEGEIAAAMIDEAGYLRALSRAGYDQIRNLARKSANARSGNLADSDSEGMLAALKAVTAENERLKVQLAAASRNIPARVDRPLTPRTRRTHLIIIAALCEHTKFEKAERGASQRICAAAEILGVPIDDETVRNVLKEIPAALEDRKK
ncbi:MAG: hypothetical protein U1A72_02840 [Sulfuritalea sp.]|nr:hypothetical protein [Sulfuritalea sp.]